MYVQRVMQREANKVLLSSRVSGEFEAPRQAFNNFIRAQMGDLHTSSLISELKAANDGSTEKQILELLKQYRSSFDHQEQTLIQRYLRECYLKNYNGIDFLESLLQTKKNLQELGAKLSNRDLEKIPRTAIQILDKISKSSIEKQNSSDYLHWFRDNLGAIFVLEKFFPEIHKFLIGQLSDRKNSSIYQNEINIFNKINKQQLKIIIDFYSKNKKLFSNDQKAFLRLTRIIHALNTYKVNVDEALLKVALGSQVGLSQYLGGELFKKLLDQLKIKAIKNDQF
ncbi:MAG: hypothetical protein LW817_08695, partial [Candidatus Caenarcaniphilales bacterium]|nr:hypothetical protein [Candidatus Caenarcaniphilales bacterium]